MIFEKILCYVLLSLTFWSNNFKVVLSNVNDERVIDRVIGPYIIVFQRHWLFRFTCHIISEINSSGSCSGNINAS